MNRKQISAELMRACPEESRADHQRIAAAILAGKDTQTILSMPETDRWPETYAWLKTELAIVEAASVLGGIKSNRKASSSRENGKKGGRPSKEIALLKKAGATFTPGHGWAFPDPNTGTAWFDESSYNGTEFLGTNAKDAYDRMIEMQD